MTTPPLTKTELAEISLIRRVNRILRTFGREPAAHAEARRFRLQLELERMGAETRDYSIFHPSSLELGSDKAQVCLRKLVYARQQNRSPVKRDFDQQTRNKFEVGHDAHGKYQGWLKWDDPDRVHVEVTAEISELRMRGSCDVVIDWELSSGRMIKVGAEIKTSAEKTWMSMKNLPIIKHRDQAAAYAASLGLDAVVFFYECKNDQRLKEFVQPWSQLEPRWDRIQARLREMNQCIDTDTLPERRLVKYECDACPFAEQCKPFRIDGRRTERLTKILSTRVNDGDRY